MVKTKAAQSNRHYSTPELSTYRKKDSPIISREYERGSRWATLAFIALFAFLSIGCAVWGW